VSVEELPIEKDQEGRQKFITRALWRHFEGGKRMAV